jgi:hypothetical protein
MPDGGSKHKQRQPFVAWRLEWVSSEVDRLWPESVPQIRNEHGSAERNSFCFARHRLCPRRYRQPSPATQRKRIFLEDRPVYPLATHSYQTWQHLPDYGAYHATLIADPALPGKWQPGEEVIYLLVFEGELLDGSIPESQARRGLTSRLSESLPIPILSEWDESIWEARKRENMIIGLKTHGDCQMGYLVQLTKAV